MEHIYKVSTRLSQREMQTKWHRLSCRRPVCGFNKQGACLSNLDVGKFVEQRKVIEVERPRHQRSIFPGTMKEAHLHLTRACVGEHNAELRKTTSAVCKKQTTTQCIAPQLQIKV